MKLSFYEVFSPMIRIITMGGVYIPGSEILNPEHPVLVKTVTYIVHFTSILIYIVESVNELIYAIWIRADGMTDVFLALTLGFIFPTFAFPIYANWKRRDMKEIVVIWEKDFINPPYPKDRKAEIHKARKNLSLITNMQIFCFIIPFAFWTGRTIFTKEPVLPILYPDDLSESPAVEIVSLIFGYFGYCFTSLWCATENVKFIFMRSILSELNHLYTAAEKILNFESSEEVDEVNADKRRRELAEKEENLRTWIIYHQAVLRFGDRVNNFLGFLILLQDLSFIIFVSTGSLVIMVGDVPPENSLAGAAYLVIYLYIQYLTHDLGGEIQRKSSLIFEAFCGRNYQLYTKTIIKNILIIQYVSTHRPLTIKATWYNDLSKKSLGKLLTKGYEMLMFMRFLISRNKI